MILIKETVWAGHGLWLLFILDWVTIVFSLIVISNKNPVISVIFFLGLYLSISVCLVLLGLTFFGLSYFIVYIGAVSILFLFTLMLLNVRLSELQGNTSNSIPMSLNITGLTTMSFYAGLSNIITVYFWAMYWLYIKKLKKKITIARPLTRAILRLTDEKCPIGSYISSAWDKSIGHMNHITSIGNVLYTNKIILLIILGFILLLTMTGAITIIKKKKKRNWLNR